MPSGWRSGHMEWQPSGGRGTGNGGCAPALLRLEGQAQNQEISRRQPELQGFGLYPWVPQLAHQILASDMESQVSVRSNSAMEFMPGMQRPWCK